MASDRAGTLAISDMSARPPRIILEHAAYCQLQLLFNRSRGDTKEALADVPKSNCYRVLNWYDALQTTALVKRPLMLMPIWLAYLILVVRKQAAE